MFRSSCLCCCYYLKHCARWIWNTEVVSFFIRRFEELRWWRASWIVSFLKFYFIIIYFFFACTFFSHSGLLEQACLNPRTRLFLSLSYFIFSVELKVLSVALCEGIQNSLGFWTPRCGFRIRKTGFQTPCQWSWDSGYHEQKFAGIRLPLSGVFKSYHMMLTRLYQGLMNFKFSLA